jgi:zinc/manganese transport system substrate-binding protein
MKKLFTAICLMAVAVVAQAKLNVVATTGDFGAIARSIGGDNVTITVLAKPTEDPHFVDAKPSLIVKLNRADAVIEGGAELELGWLPALIDGARNPKLEAGKPGHIMGNEGVSLVEVPTTLDRSRGDVHAAGNPHYMSDPENAKIVAEHIANAFCQLDSKNCASYRANAKKFTTELDAKVAQWEKTLAPYKGKEVVSYHNMWPYFANRFGLKMDLFLEPKPGIPPSPAHLAEVIVKMKADNTKVIVVQPYQNRKTAETVASHATAVVVDFPTFPSADQSYSAWLDGLVNSLAKAFAQTK